MSPNRFNLYCTSLFTYTESRMTKVERHVEQLEHARTEAELYVNTNVEASVMDGFTL